MKSRMFVVGLVALVLTACGSSGSNQAGPSSTSTVPPTTTAPSTTAGPTTDAVVYLIRDEKVAPVQRSVPAADVRTATLAALLLGPSAAEQAIGLSSAIPAGTKVNSVTVDGGVATADLSVEFTSGGGSLSMQARVAEVVYTLTRDSAITSVRFAVDGAPLTVLGGEGLVLDHPQTRADWEDLTPAILVESPLPFATVASPLHVTGTANTFEATYRYRLVGPDGTKLADGFGTATSGTGTRGTYDQTITFTAGTHGTAQLTMFESSAKDGSEIHTVTLPVAV